MYVYLCRYASYYHRLCFVASTCLWLFLLELCFSHFSLWPHSSAHNPQTPVFISFFIALRKMAYLPVPSMQTGGMLWFADLTASDPFYILPLAVTGTMFFILEVKSDLLFPKETRQQKESDGKKLLTHFITIFFPQLGAESGIDNPNLRAMKTVFRIMPLVIFPLTINFPTVSDSFAHICYCSHKKHRWNISLFFFVQTSGSLYLLADLKLLLSVPSGSAQTPLNQKKVEDPWKDQAPGLRSATERRIDRKHEKGLVLWA